METIELADGGLLFYDDAFLPPHLADQYFVELRDNASWEQKPSVFGHLQPRLTASYGDAGITYIYSGTENVALPWTPTLLEIKQRIEAVQGEYNYCLLNRYRSGADSVGLHADNEPGMGNVIGSLSLGATRTFRIRHVLETRSNENHGECRGENQPDVQENRTMTQQDHNSEDRKLTLDQFLKLSGLVETGGHAKFLIQNGDVKVNGDLETRRRRKLVAGDVVEVGGKQLTVASSLFS